MTLLFCALVGTLLINGLTVFLFVRAIRELNRLHYEEKAEIFNRHMATDYGAYRYFKDQYPVITEDMKRRMVKESETEKSAEEKEKEARAREF